MLLIEISAKALKVPIIAVAIQTLKEISQCGKTAYTYNQVSQDLLLSKKK